MKEWATEKQGACKVGCWCPTRAPAPGTARPPGRRLRFGSSKRLAVRFEYEFHDAAGQWWRAYGNELWEFAPNGLMQRRFASINDLAIREEER
ncbi:nuclear transport factor 2 family protein [Hymenobacter elongatus]|nr:nuclear transport factor 2 family protein [Hymenobacter elongatus]